METLINILIAIIAALHLYFFWLETFVWTTRGKKIFRGLSDDFFEKTKSLAANQGIYNGFLAAGLIWTFFISDLTWKTNIALFFLVCVAIAGIFGAITADKKIFYIQGLPALITITLLLL